MELVSREVLTDEQQTFLREVRTAMQRVELNEVNERKNSPDLIRKISVIADNLDLIIDHLNSATTARLEFMEAFPAWIERRNRSIRKLRKLAKALNSDRFNCNVKKLISYAASLTGDGLVLASAIAIPLTGGLMVPLGMAMSGLGSMAAFAITYTELQRVKSKVDKAQCIIQADRQLFERSGRWMKHAEALNTAQSTILEIDIVKVIFPDIKKLVKLAMNIRDTNERLNTLVVLINEIIIQVSTEIQSSLIGIKTLVSLLIGLEVVMSNERHRLLLDYANLTVKTLTGVIVLADEFASCSKLIVADGCNAAVASATTRGAVAVIGITLDAACIILTSIDFYKGSCSSHAKNIFDVANGMEKEAQVLQDVYDRLMEQDIHSENYIIRTSIIVLVTCFALLLFTIFLRILSYFGF